jgi:hypothetical protein
MFNFGETPQPETDERITPLQYFTAHAMIGIMASKMSPKDSEGNSTMHLDIYADFVGRTSTAIGLACLGNARRAEAELKGRVKVGPEKLKEVAGQLQYWQKNGTSFTCKLFTLIQTADPENKAALRLAFPDHVTMLDEWMASPDGDEYIEKFINQIIT